MTDLYTSFYYSNATKFNMLKPQKDGTLLLEVPAADDTAIIAYAVEQTGGWVKAIFNDPKKFIGTSNPPSV